MIGWLRRSAVALSLAADRADLWPAGTLAWLVYAGWLPLLLVVAPPDPSDLQFAGVSLVTSGAFPANVIALGGAVASGALILLLLAAVAEVALDGAARHASPSRESSPTTLRVLAALVIGAVPVVGALALLGVGLAGAAPAAFTSPDPASVYLRLAGAVVPQLVVLLAAAVLGQALGGFAARRALLPERAQGGRRLPAAVRALLRQPWRFLGVAAIGIAKDLLLVILGYLLLRVLWAPIGPELGMALTTNPGVLLLLVGFVATWLALLVIGGALHVALSAWWMLEVSRRGDEAPAGAGGSTSRAA